MASNLMASNSDGLQPNSNGLQASKPSQFLICKCLTYPTKAFVFVGCSNAFGGPPYRFGSSLRDLKPTAKPHLE